MKKIYAGLVLLSIPLFLTACTPNKEKEVALTDTNISEEESENVKGSLFDIAKLGKNVKCTFEYQDENGKSNGETYVAGNKIRSEFTIKDTEGEETNSYTISDGEWVYVWSSESNQGTKMKISDIENESEKGNSAENEKVGYDNYKNPVDYKCITWVPDNSKFVIPENITFIELTNLINQFKDEVGAEDLCDMCNSLEKDKDIQECKQRLNCE